MYHRQFPEAGSRWRSKVDVEKRPAFCRVPCCLLAVVLVVLGRYVDVASATLVFDHLGYL